MADVYVAKVTFHASLDGQRIVVRQGATAREGHPILFKHGAMFELQRVDYEHKVAKKSAPVEQATAAPGEKREVPEKRGPGRPKLPRDDEGNIIRE